MASSVAVRVSLVLLVLGWALYSFRPQEAKAKDWRKFTQEQLDEIERVRAAKRAENIDYEHLVGNWKLVCPACDKPNTNNVDFCTGCSFPLVKEDLRKQSDNIFLELVQGKDIGTNVYYKDNDYVVFDDKFGVSDNHLDVIPTAVYDDILVLTAEHVPMLERLYELGLAEFERRKDPRFEGKDLRELVTAGYNFPVSVKHLHLHMVLPPFRHAKVFQYPRWHSHQKVVNDLKTHGRVIPYSEVPHDAEGAAEYQRAMDNHVKVGGQPMSL